MIKLRTWRWGRILDDLGEPNRITSILVIMLLRGRLGDQSQRRRCDPRGRGLSDTAVV